MSYGSAWNAYSDAEARKAQDAAARQAYEAEQRRLEMQQWERQRQLFQESILQQEQNRRGTETNRKYGNEELGINKTFELGKYSEDTKRMAQDKDLEKFKIGNETTQEGFRSIAGMFGGGQQSGGVGLYDNSGNRIGGTYGGAMQKPSLGGGTRTMASVPSRSTTYTPQNFTLRDSLLRNG